MILAAWMEVSIARKAYPGCLCHWPGNLPDGGAQDPKNRGPMLMAG